MANNNDFFDDFFDMLTFKGQATRKARLNRFTNPLQQFIKIMLVLKIGSEHARSHQENQL